MVKHYIGPTGTVVTWMGWVALSVDEKKKVENLPLESPIF